MLCVVRSDEELAANLGYKLSAWPPALFENCNLGKSSAESVNTAYVKDGGYLLHLCSWQCHETYGEIMIEYVFTQLADIYHLMWLLYSMVMENLQLKTMNIFDVSALLKYLWKTLSPMLPPN
ncbi:hypothetical protein PR048_008714, partial [Dryococelus australis]